jgi:GTP-binding protein Era
MHQSGFVNIIGLPNVGKSTLLNALLGTKLSIVSPKAQTTRKRILGIFNHKKCQIVFGDTPGILQPAYKMQETMTAAIKESMEDADVLIYLLEPGMNESVASGWMQMIKTKAPIFVVINKVDLIGEAMLEMKLNYWRSAPGVAEVLGVSALESYKLNELIEKILKYLPEADPYFPKDDISDRNVRFFAGEMVREKILLHYKDEIPYHSDVMVTEYKEKPDIDVIKATVIVNKESHKGIIIGKNGAALKKLGTAARKEIEAFVGKKVFLELTVKVQENWIQSEAKLKRLGYIND